MQFNLKFMREFFKFFHRTENSVDESNAPDLKTLTVGEIHALTPDKGLVKIPLHITMQDRQTLNTAWMIRTVENTFAVVFHLDCFMASINTPDMNGLYATVAHEIGHYLAGHFENKPNGNLDIKSAEQDFFINQYYANPTPENEAKYMRCLFFALLKGGVNIREIEADLMALKFVPLSELVHIHTLDFRDEKNPFTVVEKVNRIKRLNAMVQDKPIDTKGYSLYIELFDPNKDEKVKPLTPEAIAELT